MEGCELDLCGMGQGLVHQSCGSLIRVKVKHHYNNNILFNKPNWNIYNINYLFTYISGYTKLLFTSE